MIIRVNLAQISPDEMMALILAQAEQIAKLQAKIEALLKKLDKGKKTPNKF
jgi:uncharacterized coiled-coil protein SlyX